MSEGADESRTVAERVRLTLESSASPSRVKLVAEMFEATLRELAPALADDAITLVVDNRSMATELRGWEGDGAKAVHSVVGLIKDPVRVLQANPDLAPTAFELAKGCQRLISYGARFRDSENAEIACVDKVFVRAMRAAARGASVVSVAGDTIVYSPILRLGRQKPSSPLRARIKLHGKFQTATVVEEIEPEAWDVARSGKIASLRVRGVWRSSGKQLAELTEPRVVGIEISYRGATGAELLAEVSKKADAFASIDFDVWIDEFRRSQDDLHVHDRCNDTPL